MNCWECRHGPRRYAPSCSKLQDQLHASSVLHHLCAALCANTGYQGLRSFKLKALICLAMDRYHPHCCARSVPCRSLMHGAYTNLRSLLCSHELCAGVPDAFRCMRVYSGIHSSVCTLRQRSLSLRTFYHSIDMLRLVLEVPDFCRLGVFIVCRRDARPLGRCLVVASESSDPQYWTVDRLGHYSTRGMLHRVAFRGVTSRPSCCGLSGEARFAAGPQRRPKQKATVVIMPRTTHVQGVHA